MDEERKYDPVTPAAKQDIRPNFLGGQGGGESIAGTENGDRGGLYNDTKGSDAAKALKSAEDSATNADMGQSEDSLAGTKANEESAGGLYSGISDNKPKKGKGGLKGKLIKGGPIAAILFAIFGIGGILAGTQSFQMFSWVAQIQASYNSMHPSAFNRSARIILQQMDANRTKNPVKGSLFSGPKFVLSKKQIANYEKNGIKYNANYPGPNGKEIRVLEYDTEGGQHRIVTADTDTAAKLRSSGVNAISINAAYQDNTFNQKFSAASKSWRGQFANWYGTKTNNFLKTNKITRNLWKDYKQNADASSASGKSRLALIKETISKRINGGEGGGVSRASESGTDADGNTKYTSSSDKNSKIDAKNVRSKLESIRGKISGGVNIGCAIVDFIGVVSLLVSAQEALQIINLTTAYMETVDKTKAGYGDEAPFNELANTMNEKAVSEHTILVSGEGDTVTYNGGSYTPNTVTATVKGDEKSAIQSAGMAALFSDGIADPNDPSVQSFNMTSQLNKIMGGVGLGVDSFMACMGGRVAAAAASIGADVILCLISACIGTLVKGFAIGAGVGLAITGIIAMLTPWVTSVLERDIVSTLAGEDLGNALVSGSNMYSGFVHKTNGGSLATVEKYKEFAVAQKQVIAEEAREERRTLSPFDISSQNTFMGSVMSRLISYLSTTSVMSSITTSNTVISNSLLALTPSSSAVASEIARTLPSEEQYELICPYLASIGAIGDSFCNPYMVTDLTTMDEDPADVIDSISDQFEDTETEEGNVKIKKDSDLMKYITYCGERTSAFGVADQNIASSLRTSTGNSTADTIIGAAPIVGDLIDIFDGGTAQANIGYIDGESCVAGNDLDRDSFAVASPKWNTAKQYQRFIEDQSLLESMGVIDKSAVTVALEEYYEENPLDDSYEGMLARYSGLDKESVNDLLDIIAYYNYIGNYDPTERYAFGEPVVDEEEKAVRFEDENVLGGEFVALEGIVYRDERNRTFAV